MSLSCREPQAEKHYATTFRYLTTCSSNLKAGHFTCSPPKRLPRTSYRSFVNCSTRLKTLKVSRRTSMTAIHPCILVRACVNHPPSSCPIPTCSTPASCPITPPGRIFSPRCALSSSTKCMPTGACLGPTSLTSSAGSSASAGSTAASLSSSSPPPPSPIRRSWQKG